MAQAGIERRGQELAYLACAILKSAGAKNVSAKQINPYRHTSRQIDEEFIAHAKTVLPDSLTPEELEAEKKKLFEELRNR